MATMTGRNWTNMPGVVLHDGKACLSVNEISRSDLAQYDNMMSVTISGFFCKSHEGLDNGHDVPWFMGAMGSGALVCR